jgi:hypothetical protein
MKRYFIITGTVTYAIKGRNILRSMGYTSEIRRLTDISGNVGCGYGVYTNCEPLKAKEIFAANGIKFLSVKEDN